MPHLIADDFLKRLMSHSQGRIVACNIVDSLNERLLKVDSVRELLDWWHQLYLWYIQKIYKGRMPKRKEQDELMKTLDVLLFEQQAPGFRSDEKQPSFLLQCKRKPRVSKSDFEFVNVTTASVLIYHLMEENDRRILAGSGKMTVMGEPTEEEIGAVLAKGEHQVRLKPGATVGRPNHLLWLTPVDGLKAEFAHIRSADCIRDRLGLIHYDRVGNALVALYLPNTAILAGEHGRPTAADAGSHARFKARADNGVNRRRSAWGYTADLEKFFSGKPTIDGLPERVAEPIPGKRLGIITITPLDYIDKARGATSKDDHTAFANRLCERCGGVAKIQKHLQTLLS